jgi:hypothetical protein
MKDMGVIQGSAEQAVPLIIGKDTVYVHTDIEQVFKDNEGKSVEGLFQYHETQYQKDEYIKLMAEQSIAQDIYLLDLEFRLSMAELGV